MYLHADTPQERIERALRKELSDLSRRAERAVSTLSTEESSKAARDSLTRGEAEGFFPRRDLVEIARKSGPDLRAELEGWIEKHQRLENRLLWLLDPERTRAELANLDPVNDADQLWCFVRYDFRPEILYCAWGNAMERISQSEAVSTFIHATGTAETTPMRRTEDTLVHYYYFFNWGADSYHGRKSVENMNGIHGHYFIHNDGMKYVLLNAAFTVLDSLREVGHRPLTEVERLGYFHAQIVMGQAMNIRELSHSWDEMYSWFDSVSRAFSGYAPQKRRMWNAIEDSYDRDAGIPCPISRFRKLLERESMGDHYRSALGFVRPSRLKVALAKAVVEAVVKTRSLLLRREPYIESLQNFMTYPNGVDIEDAGEKARSANLPSVCPFSGKGAVANAGYPDEQLPLSNLSDAPPIDLPVISWDEVRRHDTEDDLWVVFSGHVYDLSSFAKNHPGGLEILLRGVGKDLTKAFENANHSEMTQVFTLNFRIGKIEAEVPLPARPPEAAVEARA
jgi:cytochrome b involved in lipid metabolism